MRWVTSSTEFKLTNKFTRMSTITIAITIAVEEIQIPYLAFQNHPLHRSLCAKKWTNHGTGLKEFRMGRSRRLNEDGGLVSTYSEFEL